MKKLYPTEIVCPANRRKSPSIALRGNTTLFPAESAELLHLPDEPPEL
jgi:hypothetical protein